MSLASKKWRVKFRKDIIPIINKLKDKPCVICKVKYNPWIMHFDHIDPQTKKGRIARMDSPIKFKEEVAKCRVLCANCHADVTYKNKHYYGTRKIPIDNQLTLL